MKYRYVTVIISLRYCGFFMFLKIKMKSIQPLFTDNHLLVVRKPSGLLIQADRTRDKSLLDWGREYIKRKYHKPGKVYLGLVHRLDKPVSGVIVFARTSKAASRLSEQFRTRQVKKIYWALVEGKIVEEGKIINFLVRKGTTSYIEKKGEGQKAELSFRLLDLIDKRSWVEIKLETGRHHQIRLQFANLGHPIIGDVKYGSTFKFPHQSIALHARSLTFNHPIKKTPLTFTTEPDSFWPLTSSI